MEWGRPYPRCAFFLPLSPRNGLFFFLSAAGESKKKKKKPGRAIHLGPRSHSAGTRAYDRCALQKLVTGACACRHYYYWRWRCWRRARRCPCPALRPRSPALPPRAATWAPPSPHPTPAHARKPAWLIPPAWPLRLPRRCSSSSVAFRGSATLRILHHAHPPSHWLALVAPSRP